MIRAPGLARSMGNADCSALAGGRRVTLIFFVTGCLVDNTFHTENQIGGQAGKCCLVQGIAGWS